jgi:hypothetical protein
LEIIVFKLENQDGKRAALFLCLLARRAASAAIKRSSQSAIDRASFCARRSAIALTDGLTRTRIATLRFFGSPPLLAAFAGVMVGSLVQAC